MQHLFQLTHKIALITGATSGMGRAIAEAMGAHGATIIVSSNDIKSGQETIEAFKNKQITAVFIACDVSKKKDIAQLYQKSIDIFGRIDILVSCVGVAMPNGFLSINAADFEKTMSLNLQSAIFLTKLVIPAMQTRKDGSIIYLASIAGVRGNKNIGLYGISKAGLIQLARNLAVEFGPDNIRVNTISPGMIDTPFSQSLLENQVFMDKRLALTPLRRVGTPEEVAGVAVMLASKAGGFITGQNIIVDGGTTIGDGN
jgi:NAD(P)-dependent dehydrogenase (short-subunit alcohol dehydrogenase family)